VSTAALENEHFLTENSFSEMMGGNSFLVGEVTEHGNCNDARALASGITAQILTQVDKGKQRES
jgi:hypothetical protein